LGVYSDDLRSQSSEQLLKREVLCAYCGRRRKRRLWEDHVGVAHVV